jgi:hypothetical protein
MEGREPRPVTRRDAVRINGEGGLVGQAIDNRNAEPLGDINESDADVI